MIAWAIETLVASTLLMLLVLVIRAPVRRAVGPQIAYALWALPALRMLLPPLPESWREAGAAPVSLASEAFAHYVDLPVVDAGVVPEAGIPWVAIVLTAWTLGVLGFLGWHVIAYSRFCARLRAGARRRVDLADGRVAMIESAAAAGPLAFGVWRKYVAFPADFAERYDEMERDLALAHELGHHARGDLAANWIALGVLALHWFNPVAWRAFRAFRADQEMACDALVLAGRHPALRHAYGRAIVKSAHGGAVSAACHLHTINEIKGRLRMLTHHQKPSRRAARAGLFGIAGLAAAGLALTASGSRAAENLKAKVEDRMGVSIDAIEMPQLPGAPASPAAPGFEPSEWPVPAAIEAPATPPAKATYVYKVKDGKRTIVLRQDEAVDQAELDRLTAEARRSMADAERMAADAGRFHIPETRSQSCGGNGPISVKVRGADGGVRSTIICTDRIERQVAAAHTARAEGLRAAQRVRLRALSDADHARAEAFRDAESARAEAYREAAQARAEGQREALQGRIEAEQARAEAEREAEQARAEARHEAAEARAEGLRAARAARAEAARAHAEARAESFWTTR